MNFWNFSLGRLTLKPLIEHTCSTASCNTLPYNLLENVHPIMSLTGLNPLMASHLTQNSNAYHILQDQYNLTWPPSWKLSATLVLPHCCSRHDFLLLFWDNELALHLLVLSTNSLPFISFTPSIPSGAYSNGNSSKGPSFITFTKIKLTCPSLSVPFSLFFIDSITLLKSHYITEQLFVHLFNVCSLGMGPYCSPL